MSHFVLGVTGAIGAGKSTVCRELVRRGWAVLDLDDVAAVAATVALPEIAQLVPAARSAAGQLNKAALFAAMLRDPELRKSLELQLRPLVFQRVRDWIANLSVPGVLDAALLFESGLDTFCSATVCVLCPAAERRQRVSLRTTASASHFEALEAAQWGEAEKRASAHLTLSTTGAAELLDARINEMLAQLKSDFAL